jgi:alanyl-tRNA synthetase
MDDREYRLKFFEESHYNRRVCTNCGTPFWTKAKDRYLCADVPCTDYYFFDIPIKSKPLKVRDVRERFIAFFKSRGHEPLKPRPVLARWREDLFLTIASIVVFQPHVTSGIASPPANPLVISQPSVRLEDIDNVGITFGRHLTSFEMAAHHAFNYPNKYVYWKEETVKYARDFFVEEIGIPEEQLNFKESWWEGGGNAGPCLEVTVGGLELATLVFMQYRREGETYVPLELKIVDTGYGVERIAWFTQRSPTAFHAIYGDLVHTFFKKLGVNEVDESLLKKAAVLAGKIDPDRPETIIKHRKAVAESSGMPLDQVTQDLDRAARVFQVLDHTKTIALMLGDGLVPSNSGEGYLGRLVIRRALRVLRSLKADIPLSELLKYQVDFWADDFPQMRRNATYILDVVQVEEEKFREIEEKVSSALSPLFRRGEIKVDDLVKLYDSNGIPPDLVKLEASKRGIEVEVPHNFYSLVAKRHQASPIKSKESRKLPEWIESKVRDLPQTRRLYYEDQYMRRFQAEVLFSEDEFLVLDSTAFYPEGGGQLGDTGFVVSGQTKVKVLDTQSVGGIVVHVLERPHLFPVGSTVLGEIEWTRRYRLMRHHTATHVILSAAKRVLGDHVWQAGAEKTPEKGRLDITHYKLPSDEELRRIEDLANEVILDRRPVRPLIMSRTEAEERYGTNIYEGGVQMLRDIRLLEIKDWDIEACGGTHVSNTSEIGGLKIINAEKIQDGVIRLEYVAGDLVADYARNQEVLLRDIASTLGVKPSELKYRVQKITQELERYREIVKRYRQLMVEKGLNEVRTENVNGIVIYHVKGVFDEEALNEIMRKLTERARSVAIHLDLRNGDMLVEIATSKDLRVEGIVRKLREVQGAKGGGKGTRASFVIKGATAQMIEDAIKEAVIGGL